MLSFAREGGKASGKELGTGPEPGGCWAAALSFCFEILFHSLRFITSALAWQYLIFPGFPPKPPPFPSPFPSPPIQGEDAPNASLALSHALRLNPVLSGLRVAGLFEEDPPGLHSTPSFGSAHSVLSGLRLAGLFEEDPPGVHSTPSFGSASKLSTGALLTSSTWNPTLGEPEICTSSTLVSGCAGASMKARTKSVIPSQCEICSAGSRQFNLRSRRPRRNALRSDVLAG